MSWVSPGHVVAECLLRVTLVGDDDHQPQAHKPCLALTLTRGVATAVVGGLLGAGAGAGSRPLRPLLLEKISGFEPL